MRVTVDQSGRILLPKAVRDLLGLRSGALLDVEIREGALSLRVLSGASVVEEEDGLLIFRGDGARTDSDDLTLQAIRRERLRRQGR